MHGSASGTSFSGIFISYRRTTARWTARILYQELARTFGDNLVFMDVDTIAPGSQWHPVVHQAAMDAEVMLVVIDQGWLDATDEAGRRRLDDPADIVRREIEIGLRKPARVVPILVDGAAMPQPASLPSTLRSLLDFQGVRLEHSSFESDLHTVIDRIRPDTPFIIAPGTYHYHPRHPGFYVQRSIDGHTVFLTKTPGGENLWRPVRNFRLDVWSVPTDSAGRNVPVKLRPADGYDTLYCQWL